MSGRRGGQGFIRLRPFNACQPRFLPSRPPRPLASCRHRVQLESVRHPHCISGAPERGVRGCPCWRLSDQPQVGDECCTNPGAPLMCQPRFSEWLTYTQGGVLSPDGKCKPFDVTANGCVGLLYRFGDIFSSPPTTARRPYTGSVAARASWSLC